MTDEKQETKMTPKKNPIWRIVLAYFFDVFTLFWGVGYLIGWLTGQLTPNGFDLEGSPAFLLYGIMAAYFVLCHFFLRGTIWRHIFRVSRQVKPEAAQ
ncbi:MAG: hypothetical protein CML23_00685 [Rhizobiaceae bacterium]|nr:hypothetical protein [Rhizobiaceae bacterium]|tara:strand:+ start:1402 stop:1695 length:294 start_codon:yes stop_codon:yes gene_type:complete